MREAQGLFVPSRGSISNRRFLERLQEWGWIVQRVSGDWTHLTHMNTYYRIKVRSAHVSQGNSAETFNRVLALMECTWEKFMSYDINTAVQQIAYEDALQRGLRVYDETGEVTPSLASFVNDYAESLHEEAYVEDAKFNRRKIRKEQEAETRRQKERACMSPSDEVTDLTAVEREAFDQAVADLQADPPQPTSLISGRLIDRVFDALVESGEPMTTRRIASLCQITIPQATGALLGLVQYGIAERVKSGVYRVAPDMASGTTIHHNVTSPVPVVAVGPSAAVALPQAAPAPYRATQTPVDAVEIGDSEEQIVNDVLDLMFPSGVTIRAADINILVLWKQMTVDVLRIGRSR